MEFLVDPVLKLVGFIWGSVSQQIAYAKDLDRKVNSLSRTAGELRHRHGNFKAQVQDAESVGKTKLPQVEKWLTEVEGILRDLDSIVSDFPQPGGRTCFNGRCPDLCWRRKLGKKVVKRMEVVEQLLKDGVFANVAESPRPPLMPEFDDVPAQVEQQSTAQKTLKDIEQALLDEDIGVVCIWGMGGIGKTTLMKKICNEFAGTQDFNRVIWVTVSQNLDLNAIQRKIGEELKIEFRENEDVEVKRGRLNVRLKNTKFMLILDDIWEAFPLDQVGIPRPNKQNGCKIAITTRSREVSNRMEADKEIKVRTLNSMEAWHLFRSKTGDVIDQPEIQQIAEDVCEECGGLPLAIAVVGGAMRRKDRKELWQDALRALRKGVAHADVPGMEQQVFRPLKFSYDNLEDPKIQSCFLYCCLFPEDWPINILELVNYWNCEGLIDNVDTLEETLNKGLAIVESLKDACLLETGVEIKISSNYVKMHDLLRDLALWITNSSPPFIGASSKVIVNYYSEVPQEEKNWEGFGRISLIRSDETQLQIIPSCPDLVSLLLHDNWNLHAIHSSFFQRMPQLRILNLRGADIKSLPPSLSDLVNLRALILTHRRGLVELPPLGELKELEILDLACTGIEELPEGIWKLVKLKQLDLSCTKALERMPRDSISQLTSLEHLRLGDSSVSAWRQLPELKRLAYLYIKLCDRGGFTADDLLLLKSFRNLKRIRVVLGSMSHDSAGNGGIFMDMPDENRLEIFRFHNLSEGLIGIEEAMSHFGHLRLFACNNLACFSQIIGHSRILKGFSLRACEGVKCVIHWRVVADVKALDCLKKLSLSSMPNLENIFDGGPPQPPTRFQRLQKVHITWCPKLKCIFFSSMVSHLHQLEYLAVEDCEGVEEIVQGDILPDRALQRLREVYLKSLRKLRSISMHLPVLKDLQEMEVYNCSKLKKLPPLCSDIHKIQGKIEGPREWWEGIEWEDDHSKSIYSNIYEESVEEETTTENTEESTEMEEENEEENAELEKVDDEEILEMKQEDEKDRVRGEDKSVQFLQPSLLPPFHVREENEPIHPTQPPAVSVFPGGGENELLHDILSRPLTGRREEVVSDLLPGRGEERMS